MFYTSVNMPIILYLASSSCMLRTNLSISAINLQHHTVSYSGHSSMEVLIQGDVLRTEDWKR